MTHLFVRHITGSRFKKKIKNLNRLPVMCHTNKWVMSHIWMSHVTHTNESYHIDERKHFIDYLSCVTHINESCHTYEWVMSHIWMSHVTHMNESCHTHEWVISHRWKEAFHRLTPAHEPALTWQSALVWGYKALWSARYRKLIYRYLALERVLYPHTRAETDIGNWYARYKALWRDLRLLKGFKARWRDLRFFEGI